MHTSPFLLRGTGDQLFSGHFLHLFFPFSLYFLQHFFLHQTGRTGWMYIKDGPLYKTGSSINKLLLDAWDGGD